MTTRRPDQGEPPQTAQQHALLHPVNPRRPPILAGRMTAQHGIAGVTLTAMGPTAVGLFQLTQALVYPDHADSDADDVPTTQQAKLVWFNHDANQYGLISYSKPETLYHPAAFQNDSNKAVGLPCLGPGDRCLAWFNRQSGRWEILSPPLDLWRFEITAALSLGGSASAKLVYWDGSAYETAPTALPVVEFTVYDFMGKFSKPATPNGYAGAAGYARYLPDREVWEIINMQLPARIVEFELTEVLTTSDPSATASVDLYYDGFDPDPAGSGITVYNKTASSGYVFEGDYTPASGGGYGDKGIARWDDRQNKYRIIQMENP